MTTELRETGIVAVGDMPWGTHFCLFYQTQQDLFDTVISYLKAGLENNEFCLWVIAEPSSQEIISALRRDLPDADRHLAAGDIEILSYTQWYLQDGMFDPQRVINGWNMKLAQALAKGYAGLRVAADEAWLGQQYWEAFAAYEKEIDASIATQRMTVLCAYPLATSEGAAIFDVTRTHQFAIAERNGHWETLETPALKQAKAELKRLSEELEQRVVERTRALETINATLRQEIAQRKQAEDKFKGLLESAPDAMVIVDGEGKIRIVNAQTEQLFRYGREELYGRSVEMLIPERWHDRPPEHRAAYLLHPQGRVMGTGLELHGLCKDGRTFPVDISLSPLNSEEGMLVTVAIRNITERKRAEEDLRQYREHLEEMVAERTWELAIARDKAQEADRLKSAFLATMSHELRTPLNSILGFTGILLRGLAGPLNAEQTKQLQMVQSSGHHLLGLIKDVLDLSKIEAGQMEIRLESFDMRQVIAKTVQALVPLAAQKHLPLLTDVAPEVGQRTSDPHQVEQILLNLVHNAIKYTDHGEIRIGCRVSYGRVLTSVTDTGMGIKPENLDKLFTAFRQLDSTLTRKHEGTGLGLAICKRLAQLLGGEIWVESQWGVGSTFTFVLPHNE